MKRRGPLPKDVTAHGRITVTIDGKTYEWAGPVVEIREDRGVVDGAPSGPWVQSVPGPWLTIALTFVAAEMERTT